MDSTIAVFVAGALLGALVAWLVNQSLTREQSVRLEAERDLLAERITDLESAATQDRELSATLSPLLGTLQQVEQHVRVLERDRVEQFARLTEQIETVRVSGEGIREQTSRLAGALRSSTARGTWGEVQLRRVIEHAGMLPRVDFETQVQATHPDGYGVRPDVVVHLPGSKHIVVDAKAPLAAFLAASETGASQQPNPQALHEHARALRTHVDALANKKYWESFTTTPELVVCFIPGEAMLSSACATDPQLLEYAFARKVVLATPTTLLALLRTVALTWQSESLSENAQQILDVGKQLYSRLSGLGSHTAQLGKTLDKAVADYNSLVGTLERRVLVTARKLNDLNVCDQELPIVAAVPSTVRRVSAPELVSGGNAILTSLPDARDAAAHAARIRNDIAALDNAADVELDNRAAAHTEFALLTPLHDAAVAGGGERSQVTG